MINQTTHLTYELLEQILMWARSQAGKLALEPENFRFIEITDEIIKTFENQANEKAIKISSFETENIILYTDLNIFRTVMRNLISNAIKFTNRNGQINIFAERIQ